MSNETPQVDPNAVGWLTEFMNMEVNYFVGMTVTLFLVFLFVMTMAVLAKRFPILIEIGNFLVGLCVLGTIVMIIVGILMGGPNA